MHTERKLDPFFFLPLLGAFCRALEHEDDDDDDDHGDDDDEHFREEKWAITRSDREGTRRRRKVTTIQKTRVFGTVNKGESEEGESSPGN